jgi:hypothetical protein
MALVRVRHPKGTLKIELPNYEISSLWIYEIASKELAPLYPDAESFFISLNKEPNFESRLDPSSKSLLSLSHGQLLYLHVKHAKAESSRIISSYFTSSSLDEQLQKMDGKIKRPRDSRLCQHGSSGMCENCQPLEVLYLDICVDIV